MRGTPSLRGWCPTRRRDVRGQQLVHTPAMIGNASSHRRGPLATGMGQTRMRCTEIIDRPEQIHAMLQRQRAACQRAASTGQRRQTLPKRRVQPVTVGRRVAPPTTAPERRVWLSPHAAPQYRDACYANLAGDSPCSRAFSHRGSVHGALARLPSAHPGGCH